MKRIAITSLTALAMASAAPAAELLGFYDFEGNFNDGSTAGNNPTLVDPDVTFGAGNGGGQAAIFNGGSSERGINIPIDMNRTVNPNLTIGGWVNANTSPGSTLAPWGHDDGSWDRGISTAGNLLSGTTWGVSNGALFDSGQPAGGGWQFVSATYRDNSVTLNVDGNIFSTTGGGGPGPAAHFDMTIGSLNPGAIVHAFNGSIDNFFVYDNALTNTQVEAIRMNGVSAITQSNNIGPRTLQNTWDFESGDLTGWNILTTGVPGSNNVFTSGGQPAVTANSTSPDIQASAQGDFHVRTWDGQAGGLAEADAPTGAIRSEPFVLGPNAEFEFLMAGGNHSFVGDPDDPLAADMAALNLEREVAPGDWEVILSTSGINTNTFFDGVWDASLFEGETVRLSIYDTHSGGWGHVSVDDIRYSTAPIPEPAAASIIALVGFGLMLRRRRK